MERLFLRVGGLAVAAWMVMLAAGPAQDKSRGPTGASPRPYGTDDLTASVNDDAVQLFRDSDFKNDFAPLDGVTKSNKGGQTYDLPDELNDSLSSVRWNLPAGVVVVLYEDVGPKGEQLALWGKGQVSHLAKFDFNDKASRWAWYYVGGVTSPSRNLQDAASNGPLGAEIGSSAIGEDALEMFKDKNFKNTSATVSGVTGHPSATLERLPKDLPDSMTSLRWNLPPGVVVVFYQDASGLKQQAAIWGSGQMPDIDVWDFNDKVSRWGWYYVGAPGASSTANPDHDIHESR